MSLLYVMRHGQASFGQDNYDRLSGLGQEQARLTGQHLAGLGAAFDAAFCGAMARQQDTARNVLQGLADPPELEVLPGFNEFDSDAIIRALLPAMRAEEPLVEQAAPMMFCDRRAFQVVYGEAMRRWLSGRHDQGLPETWLQFLERIARTLDQVRGANPRGKRVIVFTSGGPISAIMSQALNLDHETAMRLTWVIKNASLSRFLYNQSDFSLSLFNSTVHLETQGQAELITYR